MGTRTLGVHPSLSLGSSLKWFLICYNIHPDSINKAPCRLRRWPINRLVCNDFELVLDCEEQDPLALSGHLVRWVKSGEPVETDMYIYIYRYTSKMDFLTKTSGRSWHIWRFVDIFQPMEPFSTFRKTKLYDLIWLILIVLGTDAPPSSDMSLLIRSLRHEGFILYAWEVVKFYEFLCHKKGLWWE